MIPNLYCQAYFTRDKDPVWTAYVPNRAQYPPGRSICTGRTPSRDLIGGLHVPVEHSQDHIRTGMSSTPMPYTSHSAFRQGVHPLDQSQETKVTLRGLVRAQPVGFAPGPPPGSIAPWTPTYYGRIRSLRVALLLAFGRFAPCASLSRSLQGGQSSNSRWGCPHRQPYAVPSQGEGRATADGWAANHHCFF